MSQGARPLSLLVVCPGDAGEALSTLAFGFGRQGCKVGRAADPAEAAGLCAADPCDVVVLSPAAPLEAGALAAHLGALRRLGRPILLLDHGASALPRAQALVLGAADHLRMPAFLRDVVTLGRLWRRMRPVAGPESRTDAELPLAEVEAYHLVRALSLAGRSAVVELGRRAGSRIARGELWFHDGQLTRARTGGLEGPAAFHQLLLWTEAELVVRYVPTPPERPLPLDGDLAADAEGFLREFRRATGPLGAARTVYVKRLEALGAALRAGRDGGAVLPLFDGRRTLLDVLCDSPVGIPETLRTATRLVELGAIVLRPPARRRDHARELEALVGWLGDTAPASLVAEALVPREQPADDLVVAEQELAEVEELVVSGGAAGPTVEARRGLEDRVAAGAEPPAPPSLAVQRAFSSADEAFFADGAAIARHKPPPPDDFSDL